MHYNMLSDNGSENTTLIGTYFGRWLMLPLLLLLQGSRRCQSHRYQYHNHHYSCCCYHCRFQTFQSGNVHVFCVCMSPTNILPPLRCSHPFDIPLSPRLMYSSIQLYLQPNQTVNCRKQDNFTINHCRTQSLLFEIH